MTLSFLGYEFGKNPEVQQKLQDEIDQAFDENGGEMPDYTTIQGRVAKIIYSYWLDSGKRECDSDKCENFPTTPFSLFPPLLSHFPSVIETSFTPTLLQQNI